MIGPTTFYPHPPIKDYDHVSIFRCTPIIAHTTATSEKGFKCHSSRATRLAVRTKLHTTSDLHSLVLPLAREIKNVHDFPKDGKRWIAESKDIEPEEHFRLMRK